MLNQIWRRLSPVVSRGLKTTTILQQVVVTGIQPTGCPHLGNYLGLIKPSIRIQSDPRTSSFLLIIADLHALTKPDTCDLEKSTFHLASVLMACGIDPVISSIDPVEDSSSKRGKTVLFPQSSVRGHCELAWILSSKCSANRLSHLPQWREKSGCIGAGASVALFTYPVLQTADVLLYSADVVPVGVDQVIHLELARDLARSLISQWPILGQHIRVPEMRLSELPKVCNLRDPKIKMSKSIGPEAGTIFLTDSPDEVKAKVSRAQTDSFRDLSFDPENRPGIANLFGIYAAIKEIPFQNAVEKLTKLSKVELKTLITDSLVEELLPIQNRFKQMQENPEVVRDALKAGSREATKLSSQNLYHIMKAAGLPYLL